MVRFRLLVLALLATACRDHRENSNVDVEIVKNDAPAWSTETAWRLDTAAMVRIGELEGAPNYQLHRVLGSLRLRNGVIVIANSGSAELRFYDSTGSHIRSVGRSG